MVEGSRDQLNWIPIIGAYDASFDDSWQTLFLLGADTSDVSSRFFVKHSIDLQENFIPGDTVIFRFRLSSDATERGWGWAIDNVRIQMPEIITSFSNEISQDQIELTIFPNPVTNITNIKYSVPRQGKVVLQILDASGRMVEYLDLGYQPNGGYTLEWKTRSFKPGLYLVRLITGMGIKSTIMIIN